MHETRVICFAIVCSNHFKETASKNVVAFAFAEPGTLPQVHRQDSFVRLSIAAALPRAAACP
jgi:hypothetical protein